jgi:hypothetical protein
VQTKFRGLHPKTCVSLFEKRREWQPINSVSVQEKFGGWHSKNCHSVLEKIRGLVPKHRLTVQANLRWWHPKRAPMSSGSVQGGRQNWRHCAGEESRVAHKNRVSVREKSPKWKINKGVCVQAKCKEWQPKSDSVPSGRVEGGSQKLLQCRREMSVLAGKKLRQCAV